MLDFKAWEDHMESNHLTILVLVYCWCFDTRHEGYQPEEGLMSLIHCAHEDEIPTEVSLMYIYLINYI